MYFSHDPVLPPCDPPSVVSGHHYSVNLVKAYGVLSFILVVGDLLSLGATIAQVKPLKAPRCTLYTLHRHDTINK